MTTISDLLRRGVRDRGPQPLITYYDLDTGERTELSCTSFANWVDKTVNLLEDAGVDVGESVALTVAAVRPGHWISLVWAAAVTAHGGRVVAAAPDTAPVDGAADVVAEVIGPELERVSAAEQVWACSLHPLGMGFGTDLPTGVDDYAVEVRAQPDAALPSGATPTDVAWLGAGHQWSQADLITRAESELAGRRLLPLGGPADPLDVFVRAVLAPLARSGSSVLVAGAAAEDERLGGIGQSERVDGVVR